MPCLVALLALLAPRLTIILMVVFSDYIGTAYKTVVIPFLGFLFMPLTTIAYAFGWHQTGGSVSGIYLALTVIAALIDLGLLGGAGATGRGRLTSKRG